MLPSMYAKVFLIFPSVEFALAAAVATSHHLHVRGDDDDAKIFFLCGTELCSRHLIFAPQIFSFFLALATVELLEPHCVSL